MKSRYNSCKGGGGGDGGGGGGSGGAAAAAHEWVCVSPSPRITSCVVLRSWFRLAVVGGRQGLLGSFITLLWSSVVSAGQPIPLPLITIYHFGS